ncbi:MAG: protein-ADP-ribose hydrolase [Oscillospiraceae bacterium]|nr:protein-ADP-ribose hydrolase [Oscillospiraceae bacterium]
MNQTEKRSFLIRWLLDEQPGYRDMVIPSGETEQRRLLRSLFNIRLPGAVSEEFLTVQDAYLREETRQKGVTELDELRPMEPGIYLWQGDITTLRCDAIVNAANSGMTGCYQPCHNCIDNCIHTWAGVQLRNTCAEIMEQQGHEEPTGQAKLTPAYNLPCSYVIHTVGPIVQGRLTKRHEEQLAACYRACLVLAEENGLKSIAFCCISTGVFGFPQGRAAEIAVQTVREFRVNTRRNIEVIFNVFKDEDYHIYRALLG